MKANGPTTELKQRVVSQVSKAFGVWAQKKR